MAESSTCSQSETRGSPLSRLFTPVSPVQSPGSKETYLSAEKAMRIDAKSTLSGWCYAPLCSSTVIAILGKCTLLRGWGRESRYPRNRCDMPSREPFKFVTSAYSEDLCASFGPLFTICSQHFTASHLLGIFTRSFMQASPLFVALSIKNFLKILDEDFHHGDAQNRPSSSLLRPARYASRTQPARYCFSH